MKTKLLPIVFSLLISVSSIAQGVFTVLSAKGENVVQKGTEYEPLGPGMKLPANAKIMLGEGGAVELSSANGSTVNLNKAGIYTMNDVAGNFKADNSGLAQRYLSYVFNEMTADDGGITNNMSITGSVERSLENNGISLFSPESTYFMQKATTIQWASEAELGECKVQVLNLFDEPIIEQVVTGNAVTLDLSKVEFEEDAFYKLIVVSNTNPSMKSGELILKVPSKIERAQFQQDLIEIDKNKDESSPLYYALMAKFCKVNGLYVDAVTNFEKALALAPESEMIRIEYDAFLELSGVK
ncbi:MAG: hypothetical protein OSB25_04110 [Salibacteraceae bacterium]|nr:hypothetical protein [Salibacteraceae bacterium]|tara:strand:- start:51848 stop:52741 length:894 start_codon:yes stop_codon:yes gene_type:complete